MQLSAVARGKTPFTRIGRSYDRWRWPASSRAPRIVGRAAELAALNDALRLATEGEPSFVLIGGDAGLGKTRLVMEFAAGARAAGARVLTGTCLDIGGEGLPYGPFLEALRELGLELPPAELRELIGGVAPELRRDRAGLREVPWRGASRATRTTTGRRAPPRSRPRSRRTRPGTPADQNRLFELSLALMDRLAADRPLVLVLEDLHWSDPASSDLLVFIVRTMRRGRLLLIGTFRTDDLEHGDALLVRLAELTRWPNVTRIELRPLGRTDQREMLTEILGRTPEPALLERIHARSEGNPFFAEELAAAMASEREPAPRPAVASGTSCWAASPGSRPIRSGCCGSRLSPAPSPTTTCLPTSRAGRRSSSSRQSARRSRARS